MPGMLTSAVQFIGVPPLGPSLRFIVAVPSTALPGAWPWALTSATWDSVTVTISRTGCCAPVSLPLASLRLNCRLQ